MCRFVGLLYEMDFVLCWRWRCDAPDWHRRVLENIHIVFWVEWTEWTEWTGYRDGNRHTYCGSWIAKQCTIMLLFSFEIWISSYSRGRFGAGDGDVLHLLDLWISDWLNLFFVQIIIVVFAQFIFQFIDFCYKGLPMFQFKHFFTIFLTVLLMI